MSNFKQRSSCLSNANLKIFCEVATARLNYLHSNRNIFIVKFLCEVMQRLPLGLQAPVAVSTASGATVC